MAPSLPRSDGGTTPLAGEATDNADGIAAAVEAQAPNHGDGNQDGILDANQNDVASLRASAGGSFVTVDGLGHTLTHVRAMAAPVENAGNVSLPMGMFAFELHGVARGGSATARLVLPDGSTPHHYFKQDSTGALQPFDFDGTTGAEFNGNVVTLHFVDGGRGDADGVANGVVVDPGGYGWTDIVTAATVREVTFSGASLIPILADPGTPEYPTGAQWVDTDFNGVIDPAVGDYALPVAYPRCADSVVSARFKPSYTTWPYIPSNYGLMVRGFNTLSATHPYYYTIPATPVVVWEGDLLLGPTTVTNPFPMSAPVNYGTLAINWEFSNNYGVTWTSAGHTENELYVPLSAPATYPISHTMIHTSVQWAAFAGANTESEVIAATWARFQTRELVTKHNLPDWSGKPLTYYRQWDNETINDAIALLDDSTNPLHDGKCGAFVDLFVRSLNAAGVRDTTLLSVNVWAANNNDGMLIKDWDFTGDGTANKTIGGVVYPYQNTLADPTTDPYNQELYPNGLGSYFKKTDGVWDYYWGATHEVNATSGLPGQNTTDPKSHFSDHQIIKISGKYYDPSYGTGPFNTLQEWDDASVKGFYTRDAQGVNNNYRLVFRKHLAGTPDIASDEV